MHPDDPVGPDGVGGEQGDRDRGRIRGQDRLHGQHAVGLEEDLLLHRRVLDDRLDHQVGGNEVVDDLDAREHLVGIRPALLGELRQALAHRLERSFGGARNRIVERDPAAGRRCDLSDPTAHLAGADDEDVLEPHARGG